MTTATTIRSRRPVCGLALLLAGGMAVAAPRDEAMMTAMGQKIVEAAASGQIEAAFATAASIGNPRDAALPDTLAAQRQSLTPVIASLGAPEGRVRLMPVEATIFSRCMNREYRAVYAGGEQRWRLKFRHLSSGWALSDIDVRSEPSG